MMYKWWASALIIALLFPLAYADCPESPQGKYVGWADRFQGGLDLANSTSVENFDVTLTRIFGSNGIQVNVLKDKSQYIKDSVTVGKDGILKKSDILIELYNITGSNAYIGIYTPEMSNITANVTSIELLSTEGTQANLLPGEEFQIDFSLNNTGELNAMSIHITPQFGDFEILSTDARDIQQLCQDSSYEFKYVLKTPDFRKIFNYTMYLKLDYFDENIETGEVGQRSTYYPFEVEITPALLEISRRSGNWTLKNQGRDVSVKVSVNNTGDEKAYNVEWSANVPPYIEVAGGTASFKGNILEGTKKVFTYSLVSDDPVICQATSHVTYKDRAGNEYTSFSDNETFRFSPFITIDKQIGGLSWHADPTENIMQGTVTWAINETDWWNSGTSDVLTDNPAKISINQTKNLNISVKIKNIGNAVARGMLAKEILDGLKPSGTTSWTGELKPGEEISYTYTADMLKHGNLSLVTNVSYLDVDPASFKPPIEDVEGKPGVRYCTVTLKEVKFRTRDEFNGQYQDVNINQSEKLKVLGVSEFSFSVNVSNNGSDSVHDVIIKIDTSDLRSQIKYGGEILSGQPFHYLKELKAEYYPDGTPRKWNQTNVTFNLVLRAPDVDVDKNFTIITIINYTDSSGDTYSKNATTELIVVRAVPAYEIVTQVEKNLSITPGVPGDLEMGGYGDAYIKLKNMGYAALENVTIEIKIPIDLEIYSNDTAWRGRIGAQLRRLNETWYGFSGDLSRNGSLNASEEQTLPFLIRGDKAGVYTVDYEVVYDGNSLAGSFDIKVRGPILKINKALDDSMINVSGNTTITVSVKNIGDATARDVFITDYVPPNFEVKGDTETNQVELKAGDKIVLRYMVRTQTAGEYIIKRASVSWTDELGNVYQARSDAPKLKVVEKPKAKVTEELKGPETSGPDEEKEPELSLKQIIITAVAFLAFLWLAFKLLLMSKPVSKE